MKPNQDEKEFKIRMQALDRTEQVVVAQTLPLDILANETYRRAMLLANSIRVTFDGEKVDE